MTAQLELITGPDEWTLDDDTRQAGRRGVDQARAALQSARQRLAERHDVAPRTRRPTAA